MCRFLKCHNNSFQAALVYIREVASKYADARKREDERECAMEERAKITLRRRIRARQALSWKIYLIGI